ncbi:MAG TPA: hypothetical protein VIL69_05610 [Roseomonas sp.]|jgi:hypothetical protein
MSFLDDFLALKPPLQAALATGILSALTALVMAFVTLCMQKRLAASNADQQRQLEQLKASLLDETASRTARRSYEYDMRKRLYAECEPIFFQLSEASDLALRECRDLARWKACLELEPKRENTDAQTGPWMLTNSSKLVASLYALLAPLALYVLLRSRLTTVDCALDNWLFLRFRMARELYDVFQNDAAIAACEPALEYDPLVKEWRQKRIELPSVHWWQGLSPGRLDRAVRLLITEDGGTSRLLTFGEFEDVYTAAYAGGKIEHQKILGLAANALYGFTPFKRPVFWRLIMVQVHLHHAIRRPAPHNVGELLTSPAAIREYMRLESYDAYDWRRHWPDREAGRYDKDANEIALDYIVNRLCPPSAS